MPEHNDLEIHFVKFKGFELSRMMIQACLKLFPTVSTSLLPSSYTRRQWPTRYLLRFWLPATLGYRALKLQVSKPVKEIISHKNGLASRFYCFLAGIPMVYDSTCSVAG